MTPVYGSNALYRLQSNSVLVGMAIRNNIRYRKPTLCLCVAGQLYYFSIRLSFILHNQTISSVSLLGVQISFWMHPEGGFQKATLVVLLLLLSVLYKSLRLS